MLKVQPEIIGASKENLLYITWSLIVTGNRLGEMTQKLSDGT
jgi:hypothetical protein